MIYDNRFSSAVYGEPEGLVIRPDKYGHACLYFAVVNGNAGSRKVNIYKHVIDYHPGYDATNKTATYIGTSTETSAHFKGDYPTMNYSCDTKSLSFETESTNTKPSQKVTINNGEYVFGQWLGVVTGPDADAFTVSTATNNAYSTSAQFTVTFNAKEARASYNAYLRLFSPLASTSVESNDIMIPLTGTYTGPLSKVESINGEDISVKINNKVLTVENADVEDIYIYSTTGALMAHSNSNSIDLTNFNGIFITYIKTTNSTIHTTKIVVK